MPLAWPATSWVYWFGVALITAALASIMIRRRRRGRDHGRAGRGAVALAAFLAAAGAVAVLPAVFFPQSPAAPPTLTAAVWTGSAVVLAAVGLVLGAWAIIGDPARGRRRCPKCWYDMTGIPRTERGSTCPECGRTARTDRRLLRTRRRRRHIALAGAILAAALACAAVPPALDGTWVKYPPNTVYVLAMPWLGASRPAMDECWRRFGNGPQPPGWQTGWRERLLRSRALAAAAPGNDAMTIRLGLRALVFMDHKPAALVDELIPLTTHTDQFVRWNALDVLVRVPADRQRTLEILCDALDDPTSGNRLAAADLFGAFGVTEAPRIDPPPSLLRAADTDADWKVRRQAVWSLMGFNPTPGALGVLERALESPDRAIRRNALCVLNEIEPDLQRLHAVLRRMMMDPDPWPRMNALEIIAHRGPWTDRTMAEFLRLSEVVAQGGGTGEVFTRLATTEAPAEWLYPLLERAMADEYLCDAACHAASLMGPRARPLLPRMRSLRDELAAARTGSACRAKLTLLIQQLEAEPGR